MKHVIDHIPEHVPLLEAICWQLDDLTQLSDNEILDIYERGWMYKGVLADLSGEELVFLRALAKAKQSWLINVI
ncbi:MAG: hypothetical protein V3U75_00010 [Methylococcaceae bacterium]